MNPFLNPTITIPFIKNYIADKNRIERLSSGQLQKYRNKALKKTIRYSNKVPLYRKKYKENGIKSENIRGIKDIADVPFVSKRDLTENFPDKIIPINYNKKKT